MTLAALLFCIAVLCHFIGTCAAFRFADLGVFYLANCGWTSNAGSFLQSAVFYADSDIGGNSPIAQYQTFGHVDLISHGQDIVWEGSGIQINFNDNSWFLFNIFGNAQDYPNGAIVGAATFNSGDGQQVNINCYKGDKHRLTASDVEVVPFTLGLGDTMTCLQIYYCHH
ncbi:hypothetical protein DFJ73DRAFT_834382 [Zopfochytrium polystomum]|nr:hypothetical protein DFJ73DRAFT_834382 [Zopfochytrium polystomum]